MAYSQTVTASGGTGPYTYAVSTGALPAGLSLNASTGVNNSTQKKLKPFVLSRRFDSGFALELMVKDLTIALGLARDGAVAAPLAGLTRELWAAALAMDAGPDHTHAARLSERLAGLEL